MLNFSILNFNFFKFIDSVEYQRIRPDALILLLTKILKIIITELL